MRFLWFSLVVILVAVATIVAIPRIAESYVIALIVVPMLLCMVCAWILLFQNRGVKVSRGWKEFLFFGPLQARPDNWGHRIAALPARLLLLCIAVAAGALVGILWISLG